MTNSDKETVGLVIMAILVLAFLIELTKAIFPYLVIGTGLSFLLLLACAVFSADEEAVTYVGILFVLCLIGTGTSYAIGYGFGESSWGKALTDFANVLNIVNEADKNTTLTIIDASQNATLGVLNATNSTNSGNAEKMINESYDVMRTTVKVS
jgi:hypothetical protein